LLLECSSALSPLDSEAALHPLPHRAGGVNNAVKHARASEIIITLVDGTVGCASKSAMMAKASRGRRSPGTDRLQVMKHRASVIGAELDWNQNPARVCG